MNLPLPVIRMRTAMRLHVPQHPIDQYLQRTKVPSKPMGHVVADLITAEFITGDHRHILDEGFPRICVLWKSEPLVTLVKPVSDEDRPLVLTVLTFEMYQKSLANKRYAPLEDPAVEADAKAYHSLRSQLGQAQAQLLRIREALGADSDAVALRIVKQLAATRIR